MQIDDEEVDLGEVVGAGREVVERISVEAADGRAVRVARIGHADHVLRLPAVSMLGPEHERDTYPERVEDRASMDEAPVDGRRMRQVASTRAPPASLGAELRMRRESIESRAHGLSHTRVRAIGREGSGGGAGAVRE